jgi:hypothetical protein
MYQNAKESQGKLRRHLEIIQAAAQYGNNPNAIISVCVPM